MVIPPQEVERFYRIWFSLLHFVNEQKHLVKSFPANPGIGSIKPEVAVKLRNALWADDAVRENFIAENPFKFSDQDLALVESWSNRVTGSFYIVRYLKKYTVFLTDKEPNQAYGVLGLVSPIEEVVPPISLPVYVQAVLLPYEGQIIYDSLLMPYSIYFGAGIRSSLKDIYRNLQEREGITTSLLPATTALLARPSDLTQVSKEIAARNSKILTAFQKDLAKSGLSLKMIEQHSQNIQVFSQSYLLTQALLLRGLLELTVEDIQAYLDTLTGKGNRSINITSFKRFVRFLYNTGRINFEQEEIFTSFLKGLD